MPNSVPFPVLFTHVCPPCSHYQVAVVLLPNATLPTQEPSVAFPDMDSFLDYSEVQSVTSRPVAYIASEFSEEEFPTDGQFVIGDSNQPNDQKGLYTNGPLLIGANYTFFLRAYLQLGAVSPVGTITILDCV